MVRAPLYLGMELVCRTQPLIGSLGVDCTAAAESMSAALAEAGFIAQHHACDLLSVGRGVESNLDDKIKESRA